MSERYEREIDEVLINLAGRRRRRSWVGSLKIRLRPLRRWLSAAWFGYLRRAPSEQFLIAGMLLMVFSMLANLFGFERVASWSSLLSVVCFVLGIGMTLLRRGGSSYQRRWPGQPLAYGRAGHTIWAQLRDWLRRRR